MARHARHASARHAARRDRGLLAALTSVRLRLVLCLGLVLGFGAVGTMAYWTDTATVATGSFTAGSMDMQFNSGGGVGLGTPYGAADVAWKDFVPGNTVAYKLTVKNVGNAAFHYTATIKRGSTWTYVDNALTFRLFTGAINGTAGATGSTCGGTSLSSAVSPTATAQAFVSSQPLAAGTSKDLCLQVGLAATAGNGDQGRSGSVVFDFSAAQDGA